MTLFDFMTETVASIMNTYGWPGLLAVVVVVALFFVCKYFIGNLSNNIKKSTEKTNNEIQSGFEALSNKLVDKLVDNQDKQMEKFSEMFKTTIALALDNRATQTAVAHDNSFDARFQLSKLIKSKVKDLLNRFNADRAFILELHNSKENRAGLAFIWYDMVYEEIARGITSITPLYRDQEASQLLPVIYDINDSGGFKIYSTSELDALQNTSSTLYHRLRVERQLNEAIMVGLYSQDNVLLGILVLEYEDTSCITVETLDIADIIGESRIISSALDYKSNKEE